MNTIAAISTAPGNGGIGIIRMSGKDCFSILSKIFIMKSEQNMEEISGYAMKYGYIVDCQTKKKIDEVLVSFFRAPKSYTTENMCEINSHGGTVIENQILEQCLKAGAELAEPGEFTKRAFLNGRIDLSQAEGIIDLINAKTKKEAQASFHQLEGFLSLKIQHIRKDLLNIMADIEASIDYPEYDIEEVTNEKTKQIVLQIQEELNQLSQSFESGKILKEGIRTVIVGKPNSGKSSLLNCILKEERAIVSSVEGTTRDTIEELITIHGIPLKLIDTAGIREAKDEIEEIGVKKAIQLMEGADLIIDMIDNTKPLTQEDLQILGKMKDKKVIILLNKIDEGDLQLENTEELKKQKHTIIKVSTKTREGIEKLYETIETMFQLNEIKADNSEVITNIRHKNQIDKANDSLQGAIEGIENQMPIDVVSVSIKEALENLSNITGENVSEDIITEIFSKFCLGK